ncbi:glutamate--tRNA ligase [Alicyclobacillus tolerans]|uniref:glutamate--tRNA ligase n=1 Tax=Alicyclobacillus tolerans TaxID=90970 RepID=UPI001F024920|nr:glutamate--tRNA ligase [Alicyclobacillus tolerans]MCF8563501.1 glutamate--tRNA ligase [Alicyclobacillus tolerans]
MESKVRVRFAPSPTGALHIGGARTAYFNWLFARKHQGVFVLRIDDTDAARSTDESYRQIVDSLRWLGIDWDEGPDKQGPYAPYRQSQRQSVYQAEFERLLNEDKVYPCFCSPEELAKDREEAQREGKTARYAGRCSHLSPAERQRRIESGEKPAYRFRSPKEGETVVHDLIRGDVTFQNQEIDDFIVWKADGTPTYHFASCVDDAAMKITHIVRAEEHLSNTPRHIALFQALGSAIPVFAHVPMILAPDRSKLSKRHGATSVQEYRDAGILPQAITNYLLLLGFAPGEDREVVSQEEAIGLFDLTRVAKHAAVYDVKKLEWLNAHYLWTMNVDELLQLIFPSLESKGWVEADPGRERLAWLRTAVLLVRERARNPFELVDSLRYYFEPVIDYDEKGVKKHFQSDQSALRLRSAADLLRQVQPFTAPGIERLYRKLISDWGIKGGQIIHPTRLAISGVTTGPGLFDMMALLGREECQIRMKKAADFMESRL